MEKENKATDNQNVKNKNRNRLWQYWWLSFRRFTSLGIDLAPEETINRIESGVDFRGTNVWILAFAVIVASVGLNINSTAVIIGAMLISPLMGPIMGIGLSVGIYDSELLKRSLRNFGYMVLVSIVASTTYFLISPLSDAQSELLARTNPTIYDVLIAFFGGLSGMVASSRKGEKITIISGVAIATALMPPLCTAGYGLATGQFNFFLGAFYLFFINSFFIALATAILAYYLHLPKRSFFNVQKEKQVKRYIYIFTTLVCIPSVIMSVLMIKETSFNSNAIRFMQDLQNNPLLENVQVINSKREYARHGSTIEFTVIGKTLSDKQIEHLKNKMPAFGLTKTHLIIHQPLGSDVNISGEFMENLYQKNQELQQEIESYKAQIKRLSSEIIDNEQIAKELAIQFPTIENFAISRSVYINTKTLSTDTIPTVYVNWKEVPTEEETGYLEDILKVRLNLKKIKVINK